ncbi:MAG: hypothetical protein ACQEWU_13605 [Bacillota bacterium]|uniref:Lipoprotein n=1 Tax=Virgibacillus salarius TaxID=447199 RepID=A0A941I9T1_9BACI|nr:MULTISPECIES: hypothetical protein [Virgibacillus]NAZ07363.1 hypothetical protein [Agaribacter marinus]MBR7794641.1 hypothetical protein [Virgibacillus salarius]MCC2250932.1 hypothetical protein [Virgibacillus sp. AGTR]MDY7044777.1 hypothetical protein [Virgibacillus sp. M23]QRZ16380.1 hypothetical protein JUJ52_11115 [Virgibacillus sp. AGTR]
MRILSLAVILLLLFLIGCDVSKSNSNFYLSLMGESENWRLKNYEIELTDQTFRAGNGTLDMKGQEKYVTDTFYIEVHAVINEKDNIIQASVKNGKVDISEERTGSTKGDSLVNHEGKPISLEEINNIYVVLEWWDDRKKKKVKEVIELYRSSSEWT